MRTPVDVTLGGRVYTIRPLTLSQVEAIEAASLRGDLYSVIKAALARDHAGADLDGDASAPQLRAAIAAIVALTGFERRPLSSSPRAPARGERADLWATVRGRLVDAGGVGVDRVGDVEWWSALELFAHWRRHPPMRDLVAVIAQFCGYKPPLTEADNEAAVRALMTNHPDGCVRAS